MSPARSALVQTNQTAGTSVPAKPPVDLKTRIEALAFWGFAMVVFLVIGFLLLSWLFPDREVSVAEMLDGEPTPGPEQE